MAVSKTPGEILARAIAELSDLSEEDRGRALRAINSYFGSTVAVPTNQPAIGSPPASAVAQNRSNSFSADRSPGPKEFLHEKAPQTDVERVACLAYYLSQYRDTPHFKTVDLTKINTEAAQHKFSNASFATANAMKTGYLVPSDKGRRQLSAAGERFVEALPDRTAAREAMAAARKRVRRPSTGKRIKDT